MSQGKSALGKDRNNLYLSLERGQILWTLTAAKGFSLEIMKTFLNLRIKKH